MILRNCGCSIQRKFNIFNIMSECALCMGETTGSVGVFGVRRHRTERKTTDRFGLRLHSWCLLIFSSFFFLLLHMVFQLSIYLRQPIKYVLWFLCFSYVFGFSIRVDLSKLTHLFFMGPIVVNGVGVNFCWGESFKKCKWVFFFLN